MSFTILHKVVKKCAEFLNLAEDTAIYTGEWFATLAQLTETDLLKILRLMFKNADKPTVAFLYQKCFNESDSAVLTVGEIILNRNEKEDAFMKPLMTHYDRIGMYKVFLLFKKKYKGFTNLKNI